MWAGQAACDRGFLRAVFAAGRATKLERHGLTAADQLTSLRLHDVVFASLRAAGTPDAMRLATFDDALGLRHPCSVDRARLEPDLGLGQPEAQARGAC